MKNNKRDGEGIYTWPNGRKYEGYYVEDKQEGHGVLTEADGSQYEGNW